MTRTSHDALPPSMAGSPWLSRAETRAVLDALEARGYGARIVGGAVRNALLGVAVKDVDIATTATPEDVIGAVEAAGLRAVPTGLAHGTVTVIAGRQPIEVTTLRRDVETFGRHATVAFTTDWAADAARRDFTINALYCDSAGVVHDPLGEGWRDLQARRVRFIGDARERIREDYLRILRFFRFTADYAEGPPDAEGLTAAIAEAGGLAQLSAERVRAEVLRFLAAPRAAAIARVMVETGFVARLLGVDGDAEQLARLAAIEAALDRDADPLLRLAALIGDRRTLLNLGPKLRLSNSEAERLARFALTDPACDPASDEHLARVFLYRFGTEAFRDAVLLGWTRSDATADDAAWRERFQLPERWHAPELPVRGADLVSKGLAKGPAIGRILRAFEEWWIAEDFPQDKMRLAKALSDLVKANRP